MPSLGMARFIEHDDKFWAANGVLCSKTTRSGTVCLDLQSQKWKQFHYIEYMNVGSGGAQVIDKY